MNGKQPLTRYADLNCPTPFPDVDPNGIQQGLNEWSLLGGGGLNPTSVAVSTVIVDTPTVYVPSRVKTLFIQTSGTITFTSGQPTVQLFSSRTPKALRTGATTQVTGADESLIGASATWGPAAAATLANQAWWFSTTQLAELQWPYAWLGVELKFPSAPSQGAVAVALYSFPF